MIYYHTQFLISNPNSYFVLIQYLNSGGLLKELTMIHWLIVILVQSMFMVLTCLDTFHWLQFDDFTPRKTEQTFVICCKTLDCDNMTGILHSRDGQTLGSSLARFLLLPSKFLQSGAHLWHYCQNLPLVCTNQLLSTIQSQGWNTRMSSWWKTLMMDASWGALAVCRTKSSPFSSSCTWFAERTWTDSISAKLHPHRPQSTLWL